jgi:hypothetical protein
MGFTGYNLSGYPLEEHYKACGQYMYHSMDWGSIRDSIREKGTVGIDVSDTVSFFPHLELDSEYRLICYMTSEYHGIFGEVAAVKKGDDWHPKCDTDKKFRPWDLNKLNLPECTVPAMEAIFNDGSGEGYFEAVLCALFLHALPYARFEQEHWSIIMSATPDGYEEGWYYQVELADWNPRYVNHAITVLLRKVENGIGASDGKDRIYLTQFYFYRSVNDYLIATMLRTKQPITSNHITDSNRYSDTRRCCAFTKSSVLVAQER